MTSPIYSTVVGGAIPKEYIPAVGAGIKEAAQAGILGGFPVLGVHANVYDGTYHEVDSSDLQVKLTHTCNNRLACLRIGVCAEGGILLCQLCKQTARSLSLIPRRIS